MSKYDCRFLTEDLIDELVEFESKARETEADVFTYEFDASTYRNMLKIAYSMTGENTVILAFLENKIIGRIDCMIQTSLMDFFRNGYIDWIYVLKDYRMQGIGKLLINEAEKYFVSKNVNNYYLFTASNEDAQKFYHQQNYKFEKKEVASKEL